MDYVLCLLAYFIAAIARFSKFFARLGIGPWEQWEPGEKIKILLVGYNGARNTGSDVRVMSIARQIKSLFGNDRVQISVMTLDVKALEGYFDKDVTLLPFSSVFPLDLYRACCAHHAAILCEGSALKSGFANALTLFLCEAAGIMSAQGKPCIAYGAEVGEMEPFLERAAAKLCRNAYFIARTQNSLDALKKLGLRGHAGTDAAWLYREGVSVAETRRALCQQGWDGKQPLLGVAVVNPFLWPVRASLRKWLKGKLTGNLPGQYDKWYFFSDSPARRDAYRRYIREMAAGVRSFLREHDAFPVLIGMERLDESACRDLARRISRPYAMFLAGDCSADMITGILRKLSALATSRYHAAVLSMENACPIVAVSMDERLDRLMQELSFDDAYLFHAADSNLGVKLNAALSQAYANRDIIRRRIQIRLSDYRETLDNMGIFMKQRLLDALEGRRD